jgi:NAD+ diphosphatase
LKDEAQPGPAASPSKPEGRHEAMAEALIEAGAAFRFCPACASPRLVSDRGRRWICPDCGFEYFHNVATAAGIIIDANGSLLLMRRAKEPKKGLLGLPGGFVDPGERAEDGALRECREELGWAPQEIGFLASYPNIYRYHGIPYATCDLYFYSKGGGPSPAELDPDPDEVEKVLFFPADAIPWEAIAFESLKRALRKYILTIGTNIPSRAAEDGGIE